MLDPVARRRPPYIWGLLQGCALGKVLGYKSVSVIEFGVAGGAGLLALERTAQLAEDLIGIAIEVHGFDLGAGLPPATDYRDCPNLFSGGQFPMDEVALRARLNRAQLHLGPVDKTIAEFTSTLSSPVAFVSFDLDLYSSTQSALQLFAGDEESVLPRVVCYFDDIVGYTFSEHNGARLAIREFNDRWSKRKISPIYGLKYYLPAEVQQRRWSELIYLTHFFEHSRYNEPDSYRKPYQITIDDQNVTDVVSPRQ